MSKGYCPYCGLEVDGSFTYCPSCGNQLPSFEEARDESPAVTIPHRMELTENVLVSINYASLLFKDLGTLIVLAILWPIPLLNLVATGYISRIIRQSPESEVLPPLQDFGRLWIEGFRLTVVSFLYMLIPGLLIAVAAANLVLSSVGFSMGKQDDLPLRIAEFLLGNLVVLLPLLIGLLLLVFLISIVLWVAIVHSVKNDSILKAFSFREIFQIIGRIGWGKYLLWLFVMFILGAIFGTIGRTPFVGWFLLILLQPPFYVFLARSAAQIYSEGEMTDTQRPGSD